MRGQGAKNQLTGDFSRIKITMVNFVFCKRLLMQVGTETKIVPPGLCSYAPKGKRE